MLSESLLFLVFEMFFLFRFALISDADFSEIKKVCELYNDYIKILYYIPDKDLKIYEIILEIDGIENNTVSIIFKEEIAGFLAGYAAVKDGNTKLDKDGNPIINVSYVKMPEEEIYRKVTEAAEILGITDLLDRKPRALSGGQRQRVAIGRAIVRNAKVFLMDEPLSNLDAKLRNQMRAELILLHKKINTTFIYVTHDQTEAMTLGDRIVIMKDGYIQQVGTPQQLFDSPANLFVAGFIGAPQMNFFNEAKLVKANGEYHVEIKDSLFPVGTNSSKLLDINQVNEGQVVVGVRPEHMSFSIIPNKNALKCKLVVSEMMGSELHLHLALEDGSQIVCRVQTVNLTEEERRAATVPGSECYITFEGKVIHLFDKNTSTSLLHPEYEYKY